MKTNLLTLIIFAVASVLYSCRKESTNNTTISSTQDNALLTNSQRRIIISNCSGHSGCHSSARISHVASLLEANLLLRANIDPAHNLSICERSKLQLWFNGEGTQ